MNRQFASIQSTRGDRAPDQSAPMVEVIQRTSLEGENPYDLICEVARSGRYLYVSPSSRRILGVDPSQLVSQLIQNWVHPDDVSELQPLFEAPARLVAIRHRHQDGSWRWLEGVSQVTFKPGEPDCRVVVFRDVTARKQVEKQLREQAGWLDLLHDAIFVHDLKLRVQFWNRAAITFYGWTVEEAMDQPITDLVHPEVTIFKEAMQKVQEQGNWQGEMRQVGGNRESVVVHSRWTLLRNEVGEAHAVLVMNTNITEQKKLETKFLRAQRMESIGTLASGIAHDLNNILSPILMSAQVLRRNPRAENADALLHSIETNSKRGSEVVNQLLNFTRGEEGERVLLQFRYLIKEMVKVLQATFPCAIEISYHIPNQLWLVPGDPTQLHQILLNLCVNARDAMPEGGRLHLTASNYFLSELDAHFPSEAHKGPYVVLEVTDTGSGIPPAIMNQIFDPFFTTKSKGQGTGLGLATVLGIARNHGGFVTVQSEIGEGTTVKVFLPARPEES